MIYILGEGYILEGAELSDSIKIASTNIEHILNYLLNEVRTEYVSTYEIIVLSENNYDSMGSLYPNTDAFNSFVKYTPHLFTLKENREEYEYVKDKLFHWCDALKEKIEKERREREKAAQEEKERRERELYERLKVKYEKL